MRMPKLLLIWWQGFKYLVRNYVFHSCTKIQVTLYINHLIAIQEHNLRVQWHNNDNTNETAIGVIGIVNSALEEVLVESGDIVVSLDLSRHVGTVQSEGAHVLVHLLDWFQRLHHRRSLVQNVLLHRHRISRRLPSVEGHCGFWGLVAWCHWNISLS